MKNRMKEDGNIMDGLLDYAGIAKMLGLSVTHTRNRITKQYGFPTPAVRISSQTVRWRVEDIKKWMTASAQPLARQASRFGHKPAATSAAVRR